MYVESCATSGIQNKARTIDTRYAIDRVTGFIDDLMVERRFREILEQDLEIKED
jgi:hypothetical protein